MAAAALRDAAKGVPEGKGKGGKNKKGGNGGGKGFGKAATATAAAAANASPLPAALRGPAKVVVTGCLAQRYGVELAESLPEADLVVGFEHYGGLPAALAAALGTQLPKGFSASSTVAPPGIDGENEGSSSSSSSSSRVRVGEATVPFRPEGDRVRLTPRHSAYLRVAEGCSHACTFCAIPGFR